VAYRSKTISDDECNYDIHDKELLALVQAFHEWKRYTRGNPKPTRVLIDHKDLVTLMTTKELNERQALWMQELSQYNFEIEYRSGREGGKPDTLIRREGDLPTAGDKRLTLNVGILLSKERYGISQRPKKSSSTYWKQPNFETRTKERYRRLATSTTKSKTSKETWTKEGKR